MSNDVHYKGRLKKLKVYDKEAFATGFLISKNKKRPKFYETDFEYMLDDFDEFIEVNGDIYAIVEKTKLDPQGHFLAQKIKGDIIEFDVKYYNGGCGFSEAIESAIEGLV